MMYGLEIMVAVCVVVVARGRLLMGQMVRVVKNIHVGTNMTRIYQVFVHSTCIPSNFTTKIYIPTHYLS